MATYKASMCLATNDGYVIPGCASNDFLVYTGSSNQNMLFGTSNTSPVMTINGSNGNVAFKGNVTFNNQMNLSGVMITQTTSAAVQNISSQVTAVTGFSNSSSGVNITIPGPSGNNAITFGNSNGTEFMRLNQIGYVGVGTTTPAYPLDVNGSTNMTSNLTLTNPACALSNAGSMQVGGTLKVATGASLWGGAGVNGGLNVNGVFSLSNSTGTANINSSNTFVGIGTTSPAYTLDVNGTANVSSNLSVTGNVTLNSNLVVIGNLTACNVSYVTSNITVFSSEVINSNLNVYQMTTMCNVNVLSNMNLKTVGCAFSNAGNLQVGGNVSITGALSIASSSLVTNLNAQYLNGNNSSYYTNLGNMNTGTLSTACVVPASCISGTVANATSATYLGGNTFSYYTNLGNMSTGTLSTACVVPASCVSGTVANASYATTAGSVAGGTYAPTTNATFYGTTTISSLNVTGNIYNGSKPAFCYNGNNFYTGQVIYAIKQYDNTNSYNASTGYFTAPVAGFYYFSAIMNNYAGASGLSGGLFKNVGANQIQFAVTSITSGDIAVSGCVQLAVNDTVTVWKTGNSHIYNATSSYTFSGFLITPI